MAGTCKICGSFCFNSYGICVTCTQRANLGVRGFGKAFDNQMDKYLEESIQNTPLNKPDSLPKPKGSATSINTNLVELMEPTQPRAQSRAFDTISKSQHGPVIEELINLYEQKGDFFVSAAEAATKKDHVVKSDTKGSNRIDRQGPDSNYPTIHAIYAIQLGTLTVGGIHMQSEVTFTGAHLANAFRLSLKQNSYVRVYFGERK